METNLCAHKGVEFQEDEAEVLKQLTNPGLFLSKSQPPLALNQGFFVLPGGE